MKSGETMENQELDRNTAQRPTDTPVPAIIGPKEVRLFGRKVIYADYTEDEMNADTIAKILNDVFSVHLQNSN